MSDEQHQVVMSSLESVRVEHRHLMMFQDRVSSGAARSLFGLLLSIHGVGKDFAMPSHSLVSSVLGLPLGTVRNAIRVLLASKFITLTSTAESTGPRVFRIEPDLGKVPESQVFAYHQLMDSVGTPTVAKTAKKPRATPAVQEQPVPPTPPTPDTSPQQPVPEAPPPAAKKRRGKTDKTPEERAAAAAMMQHVLTTSAKSAKHMEAYLLHGREGLALYDANPNRPWSEIEATGTTTLNWRKYLKNDASGQVIKRDDARPDGLEQWTAPAFLGYYWYLVSAYMNQRGFPIYPPNIKKMTGLIQQYLNTQGPISTFDRVVTLGTRFDVVMDLVNKRESLPGEDGFSNSLVEQAYRQYCALSLEQKTERFNMIRNPQQ